MLPAVFSLSFSMAALHFLLALPPPARAPCPPVFFAQAISHRQVRAMDFYFTKFGILSAAECANLCGQRHFCQSAVFNHDALSCALSPSRPVHCDMVKHRFNTFHLTTDGADALSMLACIQHCESRGEKEKRGFSTDSDGRGLAKERGEEQASDFPSPDFLPMHDPGPEQDKEVRKGPSGFLGAVQRLHQMQMRLEQILGEAERLQAKKGLEEWKAEESKAAGPQKKVHFRAAPLLRLSADGTAADFPLAPTNFSTSASSSQQLTQTLQNGTQLRLHTAGFVAKLRPGEKIKLLTGPLDAAEVDKQLIQLGRTLSVEIPLQLVTMAPELFESATPSESTSAQSPSSGVSAEPTVVDGRILSPEPGFLHSLLIHHGKMPREGANEGKALSLDDPSGTQQPVAGTVVCFRYVQHRRLQYDNEQVVIRVERDLSLNECRCACANTWREDGQAKCKSLRFSQADGGTCELLGADHNEKLDLVLDRNSDYHYISCEPKYLLRTAERMCKKRGPSADNELPPTTEPPQTTPASTPSSDPPSQSKAASDCFERIPAHSLKGTAAGLERGVSLSECECLCANSLRSRMYSFQCASASYFHADRDCVLNLESRHSAPENFAEEKAEQEVTYLGLLCPAEPSSLLTNACISPPTSSNHSSSFSSLPPTSQEQFPSPSTSAPSNSSPSPLSDSCFLEQPGFVLEGIAFAVETEIDAAKCKCLCALANRGNSTECQSAQFYAESRTCLLNRENRASAPERFSYDEKGENRHSYLDFRCTTDKKALADYLEANCQTELEESGEEGRTTGTAETVLETTTAQLKLLGKGKRKKGRKLQKQGPDGETTKLATTEASTTVNTSSNATKETEAPEEAELETRTVVPSSTNLEESKIPESETAEDGGQEEEKLMPGWRTVRVQRGNEGEAQAQADPVVQVPAKKEEEMRSQSAKTTPSSSSATSSASSTSASPSPSTASAASSPSAPSSTSTTTSTTTTTTTTSTTSTTTEYPPVGQCHFSALYQTVFNGARLLKRLLVESPAQCLAACHWENCRSANLIQMEDKQKVCELFRDSIVEFRRNDVLSFDRLAVHFDSVQCKSKNE